MPPVLRTDINTQQLPGTLPNVGGLIGKNTIVTDPDFGTRIMRLTDGSDNTFHTLQTADGPQIGLWNTNDTLFVAHNTGGVRFLYQFNPATMQGVKLPFTTTADICFSRVDPGIMYSFSGTAITQNNFSLVAGVWTFQSSSAVADYAAILPGGFVPRWNGSFFCSQDDSTFSMAFSQGAQDTGFTYCIYQRGHGGGGYRMLNTSTGAITGDWGTNGTAILTNSSFTFPFLLHEAAQMPNPTYAEMSIAAHNTDIIWEIATLNLVDEAFGGHKAKGYLHQYSGNAGAGQLSAIPLVNPVKPYPTVVPKAGLPPGFNADRHFGFGFISTTDNSIVWSTTGANTPQPFGSAWEGEVFGYDVQTGIVYRACHVFASFKAKEFIAANAIGVPSQTGKYVAFCSDWAGVGTVGPLGSTSGAPVGTVGVDARSDVFIVEIPFGSTAPTITSGNAATFAQGAFGSFTVDTTGTPTPSIAESGSLPGGVSFLDNGNGTATLSGTPAASGAFPLTITASNGVSPDATQPFTLTVTPTVVQVAPAITSANSTTFKQGIANAFNVTTTGTPTPSIVQSFGGSFPSGVGFVDNGDGTGTLAGTPTAAGTFNMTFTASNGIPPNAVQPFALAVNPVAPNGTVIGKFVYPTGAPIANGNYQWSLLTDALQTSIAMTVPTVVNGTLDSSGNMSQTLVFNDLLQTGLGATTFYQLTVKAPAGGLVWNENYYLTGTAADLTLILPSGVTNG